MARDLIFKNIFYMSVKKNFDYFRLPIYKVVSDHAIIKFSDEFDVAILDKGIFMFLLVVKIKIRIKF